MTLHDTIKALARSLTILTWMVSAALALALVNLALACDLARRLGAGQ